jgi:hypothetical protein
MTREVGTVSLQARKRFAAILLAAVFAALSGAGGAVLGTCGPFTDTAADSFCSFVLEIFYIGITTGTTPATYDPTGNVSRLQMAAFLSRAVDGILRRGSARAALARFGTPQGTGIVGQVTLGFNPDFVKSDGADVWVSNTNSVFRVRASDGKLLGTWTAATQLSDPLVIALGRVVTPGLSTPGNLYVIDPTQPPGAATLVASNVGGGPHSIVFDGARFWTANGGTFGSVSIITPGPSIPWTVTTVTAGIGYSYGSLFDGNNVWITDGTLRKLDASGAVVQTVGVGSFPYHPGFDGANIWVPNSNSDSVSIVRAATGAVLQTLTGNGLSGPAAAAFDGERVLVTNPLAGSVSLWKAASLTALGDFTIGPGTNPFGACSDGLQFWITLNATNRIARF